MKLIKKMLGLAYWFGLIGLVIYVLIQSAARGWMGWDTIFHLAYYAPPIALLAVISGQIDMLTAIQKDGRINIQARCLDFIHWLFLIFLNIGIWLKEGVSISWFIGKLVILAVIGWQIGVAISRKWRPTENEKIIGGIAAVIAFGLGLGGGFIRASDPELLGWGWALESITAIIATLIVFWWIYHDIKTISVKARDYPRKVFHKGIFNNTLIIWFWLHMMSQSGLCNSQSWLINLGLTVNTILGNIIYWIYYLTYEYYLRKQRT